MQHFGYRGLGVRHAVLHFAPQEHAVLADVCGVKLDVRDLGCELAHLADIALNPIGTKLRSLAGALQIRHEADIGRARRSLA